MTVSVAVLAVSPAAARTFHRGDPNGDGAVDLSDAVAVLNYLFSGGGEPECEDAADTNDDGRVDISDVLYLLSFLFQAGPSPADPFGDTGGDPTTDNLSCPGVEMIWHPTKPLDYLVTVTEFPDALNPRITMRRMSFDVRDDGTVRASGSSFPPLGQVFDFHPSYLVVPKDPNTIVPADPTWLILPEGTFENPGDVLTNVCPSNVDPGTVTLQGISRYTLTASDDHRLEFHVDHSARLVGTDGLLALSNFLTPADGNPDDTLSGLAALIASAPIADLTGDYDRARGVITSLQGVWQPFSSGDGPGADGLRSSSERREISIVLR